MDNISDCDDEEGREGNRLIILACNQSACGGGCRMIWSN